MVVGAKLFIVRVGLKAAFAICALLLAGCSRSVPRTSGPLPQRGYLWQRDWTPAVIDAVVTAQRRLDGVVLLGGEVEWIEKKPSLITANIDWEILRSRQIRCGLALRIAPFAVGSGRDDSNTRFVVDAAQSLVDIAASHGVALSEFQIDFDCTQKNLRAYRGWLRALRQAVHPVRFVLTTLPAWLDDPEFVPLVREADGYVLQVHSVPISERQWPSEFVRRAVGANMGEESGASWLAIFCRASDLSLQRWIRRHWQTHQRRDGQCAAGLAAGHARLGVRHRCG